ncbi:MAG: hypothetical protein AB7S38_17380 [Vulcanimicrobiota bacterium]
MKYCVLCCATTPGLRYCPHCDHYLLNLPRDGHLMASLSGGDFPAPRVNYETEYITELATLVDACLDGEDAFEELHEHAQMMSERLVEFEDSTVPEMLSLLDSLERQGLDDDFHSRVASMLARGLTHYDRGCGGFREFFDSESEELDRLVGAFDQLRQGNNLLLHSLELVGERLKYAG